MAAAKVEVECPKCGQPGVEAIDAFRAKGHVYYYRVVRHGAKRCIIERVKGPTAEPAAPKIEAAKETAPPAQPTAGPTVAPPFAKPVAVKVKEEGTKFGRYFFEPIGPAFVSKPAWYAFQAAASWGSFRENPTEENFGFFVRTVEKVASRFKGEVEEWAKTVIEAAKQYKENPSYEARGAVNEAVHNFITAIIKAAAEEEARAVAKEFAEAVKAVFGGAVEAVAREVAEKAVEEAVKRRVMEIDEETKRVVKKVFITKKGYTKEEGEKAREFIRRIIGD